MLTTIREKTQGWFAGTVLTLIAALFVVGGVASYFESDSKIVVARVGSHDISVEAYKTALEEQRRSLQESFGRNLNPKLFDTLEFKTRILDNLVDQALLIRDAEDQGYRISDAELDQRITGIPVFQRDGRFDPKLYERVLRDMHMSPQGLKQHLRQDALIKQVADSFELSTLVTKDDIDTLLRLETQSRQASYVVIKPQQYLSKASVAAGAVDQYYTANSAMFKSPERVRIDYIRLSAKDLAAKVSISDDELQKAYSQDLDRYTTPEQRKASHILIRLSEKDGADADKKALQKAEALRQQLVQGSDFAVLAKKNSDDPGSAAKGGDLGYVARNGTLVKPFEDALFGLKKGELSQPVRTSFGYHLIKLVDVKPQTRKSFNEVHAEIESALRTRKAEEQFYEMSERLNNLVYEQSDSLKPAAEALGLSIAQSDWFPRSGGEGIAADPHIVEAAFDPEVLGQGRNSNAIETAPNTVVVLRVSAHQAAAALPLTAVRGQIEATLKQTQAQAAAKQASEKFLSQLREGVPLATLARSQALTVAGGKLITRRQSQGMDAPLVEAVFAAPRPMDGKWTYGSVDVKEGYAVYAVSAVKDGSVDQADAELKNLVRRTLSDRRGREYYTDYRAGLRLETQPKLYLERL